MAGSEKREAKSIEEKIEDSVKMAGEETVEKTTEEDVKNGSAASPIDLVSELKTGETEKTSSVVEEAGGSNTSETAPNSSADEANGLSAFGADVRDQDDLERKINRQADEMLVERANERDRKRLERAEREKSQLELQIRRLNQRLANEPNIGPAVSRRLVAQLSQHEAEARTLAADIEDIAQRITERESGLTNDGEQQSSGGRMPSESHRDFLIRTGKITPFSKAAGGPSAGGDRGLQSALLNAETGSPEVGSNDEDKLGEFKSHQYLSKPGFADSSTELESTPEKKPAKTTKRRKLTRGKRPQRVEEEDSEAEEGFWRREQQPLEEPSDGGLVETASEEGETARESTELETDFDGGDSSAGEKRKRISTETTSKKEDLRTVDDGNEKVYQKRLTEWARRRSAARQRANGNTATKDTSEHQTTTAEGQDEVVDTDPDREAFLPHPNIPDKVLDGDYRIPGDVYPALFDYQKTGVQWLWELYSQRVGGIVGDEMGLGKTIQVIAFLAGLHHSKMLDKPVIVVAPATLLKQWVGEFHLWWPALRVSILHSSGSGMMDVGREAREEDDLLNRAPGAGRSASSGQRKAARKIVNRVVDDGHVLVTTYAGLQMHAELLIPVQWGYSVLDEGHTIRNPNTSLTIHCKELRTPHRVILSGTPIQNNLVELWSLFDFVFPMRLGNLMDFKNAFEIPIRIGGYANASNLQVQTANKCAEALKDAIAPYLLQRIKADVAADLPKKTERVLFCKLTRPQRDAYEAYLASHDLQRIMDGKQKVLAGIDILRKICNHPDLPEHRSLSVKADYKYGSGNKSGKMIVVRELINVWKNGGHKTLLFAQHRIMLDILEKFVQSMDGVTYRRMDGTTPITQRQGIINEFNRDPNIHLFLLTTKVGGLGVNLTGADRVIIFDPDWNPSTDLQARERAWRLGQKRSVEIYRLMVAGTIEEKIFHRQIFKQFLSNKILKDPKQRQTFQMSDLHDLFTLGNPGEIESETGRLFKGTETRFEQEADDGTPEAPKKPAHKPALAPAKGGKLPARFRADEPDNEQHAEAATISNLAGVSSLRTSSSSAAPTDAPGDSENRLMSALFARAGVSAAFEHDRIVNGKRVVAADPKMVQREAERAAKDAAAQLARSEKTARATTAGTVTWTGSFGTAGRPEEKRRAGPGAAGLLQALKAKQAAATNGGEASDKTGNGPARFLNPIRDFIRAQGGTVYTQMLIDHFNWQCKTPRRTEEFQAMLKEMAVLEKGRGGRGMWRLKQEYE